MDRVGKRRKTTDDFILEATKVWGGRWDYSKTEYHRQLDPVVIICLEHGEFRQFPQAHLRGGVGCSQCSGLRVTAAEFLSRAKERWGERWDYTSTTYTTMGAPTTFLCREHGPFNQTPTKHLAGVGCPQCHGKDKLTTTQFLSRASEVWADRWDYSPTVYNGMLSRVTISCRLHGEFTQGASNHLQGQVGCPACSGYRRTTEHFIADSETVWGDRWRYPTTEFDSVKGYVEIECPQHGLYTQYAESHLLGRVGCRRCNTAGTSGAEKEVAEFIRSLGTRPQENVRGVLKTYELDIYLPEERVAVEFNGTYYHSEKFRDSSYHARKLAEANEAGVRLIQVWEDEWVYKRAITEEHLRQVLGKSSLPKVPARTTSVVSVPSSEARNFLDSHHIQGASRATHYLGLMSPTLGLVALSAFKKRGNDFELVRYATSLQVQGGHSKLVTAFERSHTYGKLITFADLCFSDGMLYEQTGWVRDGMIPPDYKYLVKGRRVHKFNYRIRRFKEDPSLTYVGGATEKQLADLNSMLRVYDAGKIRYVRPHPTAVI